MSILTAIHLWLWNFFFSFLMKEFTLAFKKLRIEGDTNDSYEVIMCNKIIYYIP